MICPNCGERFNEKAGSRIDPSWQPSPELILWAHKERPDVDVALQAAVFRDYWLARSGQIAVKRDWDATWRNWIRNATGGLPIKTSPKRQPTEVRREPKLTPDQQEANKRRIAEMAANLFK